MYSRVVKSSGLPVKIASYLVSIGRLLFLAFLYGWCFLNKISLDWLFTLTTQPSTSKLSDIPVYSLFNKEFFGHWELGIGKPLFSSRSSKSCALSAVCTNAQWPITNSQRLLKQPLLNQLYVVWSVTNTGSNLG